MMMCSCLRQKIKKMIAVIVAVSPYFSSKQILPFDFAEQYMAQIGFYSFEVITMTDAVFLMFRTHF